MKTLKGITAVIGIVSILGGCSGSETETGSVGGGEGETAVSAVPSLVKETLDKVCSSRPTPMMVNGIKEVLSEQDEGNTLSVGTLRATNLVGTLYVEPSPDGSVYWGARKWALDQSKEKADEAMKKIKISSKVSSGESQVIVDHPASQIPGTRFEVCLVIKAPAEALNILTNGSGNITSVDHAGMVDTALQSGTVTITQKGSGNILAAVGSGDVTIETNEQGGTLSANSGSGNVTITQKGPGFVTAHSSSGQVTVDADSRGGADLETESGNLTYTLRNGGVALQNDSRMKAGSGNVTLELSDGFGLELIADVTTGNMVLPDFFPAAETKENGKHLGLTVNGGGKTLTLSVETGNLIVDAIQ